MNAYQQAASNNSTPGRLSTEQIERARSVDLVALIGTRVRLLRRGNVFWGKCPFHPDKTPSFKVEAKRRAFRCFGCGAHGDAIAWLMKAEGLTFPQAVRRLAGDEPLSKPALPPADPHADERQAEEDARRTRRALAIFEQAQDILGTPSWRYLERRGVLGGLPSSCGHALRWHPACPWERGTHGCMVGLYSDALSRTPKAIHRTAITADGAKIGRMALGPIAGCVIRLWPAVSHRLVIGEGIETSLGAYRFEYADGIVRPMGTAPSGEILLPCWAAGSAGNLAELPVIPDVPKVFILVDHDASQAGQKAALECARRWHDAGRRVIRLMPDALGSDFADAVAA